MVDKIPIFTHRVHCFAVIAWLALVVSGFWAMAKYEYSPGVAATVVQWPVESAIVRASDRPTLVVFAHPQCPCTQATVVELEQAMVRCGGMIDARVGFFKPAGASLGWAKTDLWKAAEAIAGVSVFEDIDGAEARRFGSETSGQALLFSVDGLLMFSGGITAARGHVGENDGRSAVVSLAHARAAEYGATPVFGCSLVGHREAASSSSIP